MKNTNLKTVRKTIDNLNQKQIAADRQKIIDNFKVSDNALLIFDMFCKTPELDIATIANKLPISRQSVTKIVNKLCNNQILSKVASKKNWGIKYRYGALYGSVADLANNTTKAQNADGLFLYFNGMEQARLQAGTKQTTIFHTYKYHNDKPNNAKSQNKLFIGDNLDVMKFIMPEYEGTVDLAYLDIPYNMPSNRKTQAYDDYFDGTCDLLCHLYPRLVLVKRLLKEYGIIALSVSEHEECYVKALIDNVFHRSNLVNNVVVENASPGGIISGFTHKHLIPTKGYLLIYAKNIDNIHLQRLYEQVESKFSTSFNTVIEKQIVANTVKYIKTPLVDYLKQQPEIVALFEKHNLPIQMNTIETLMDYDVEFEDYVYQKLAKKLYKKTHPDIDPTKNVSEIDFNAATDEVFEFDDKLLEKSKNNVVYHFKPFFNKLQKDYDGKLVNTNIRTDIWRYSSEKSKIQSEGGVGFSASKKPLKIALDLLKLVGKKDLLCFEPYGGASVMSHGCLLMNKGDGGKRRFIVCQIPEKVNPKSEEAKAGFKTVDQITIKRIKNVIKELNNDDGFQIFKTSKTTSNG